MSTEHTPAKAEQPVSATNSAPPQAFTFGEPEAVMDRREILDYVECWLNGNWYETPISFDGLARSLRAATHHGSAVHFKAQVLASTFRPHKLLSRGTVHKLALDFITFGNCYLERVPSRLGDTMEFRHSLARYTRRGKEAGSYWFVRGWQQEHEFPAGSICHVIEPDVNQEIYGLPQYLAALQSAWLNESATLFRRRYYNNGSHAGFILYLTDPAQNQDDVDAMRAALKSSKGVGNFRNLFYYSPNGKEKGIQLISVAADTADLIVQQIAVLPAAAANRGGSGGSLAFEKQIGVPLSKLAKRWENLPEGERVRFFPCQLAFIEHSAQVHAC